MANDRNRENTRNSSQSGSGREDESKRMPGSQDRNPSGQSGSGSESSRSKSGQSESGERGRSGSDSQSETGSSRRGSNPTSNERDNEGSEQPDQE